MGSEATNEATFTSCLWLLQGKLFRHAVVLDALQDMLEEPAQVPLLLLAKLAAALLGHLLCIGHVLHGLVNRTGFELEARVQAVEALDQ